MAWYRTLLDRLEQHLIDKHGHSNDVYILKEEYDMTEEYLLYEKFGHGKLEWISCPFVGCKWCQKFTINYDLLIAEEEE